MSGYTFVNSLEEFNKTTSKKIGFFTYPGEPPTKNLGREPSLESLTEISLNKISKDKFEGFLRVYAGASKKA